MKLFGEFLVEKGLITSDQLAEALVEQLRAMPCYAELAWKSRLVNAEELLQILKLQTQKRIGFLEALRELGLSSQEREQALLKTEVASRTPLGEILVKRGMISLEKVTHSLDEFLGEIKCAPASAPAPPADPAPADPAPAEPAQSEPGGSPKAQAPAPAGAPPQQGDYEIFLETYTPDVIDKLGAIAERFLNAGIEGHEQVKFAFDEIHRVRGAARLAGAAKSEEYCAALEGDLQLVLAWQTIPEDLQKNIGRAMKAWCEVMGALRDSMAAGKAEAAFFDSSEAAAAVEKLANFLEILKFNVDMAG